MEVGKLNNKNPKRAFLQSFAQLPSPKLLLIFPSHEVKKMDTARFSHLQAAKETNFRQKYQIEVEASGVQPNKNSQPNEALIYGWSFSFVALFTGTIIWFAKTRRAHKIENFFKLNPFNQVPCRNCQYFSGNFYLKCAVNPSDVLTNKAINCSDYCPQNKNDSEGKLVKDFE
jgi:hypothetical protein